MANLSFDFNKIKRTFLNVTLKDGTILQVKMPTKNTMGKVQQMNELMNEENANLDDVLDTIAGVMSDCLSNNMNGIKVASETIAEEYDFQEMIAFMQDYYDKFVGSIMSNPN